MSLLIGIPCFKNKGATEDCFNSIKGADVLLINNGADSDVSSLIREYDCEKIILKNNILVNPAWNLILERFINSDHDTLFILSSDVILHHRAIKTVLKRLKEKPDEIPIPISLESIKYLGNKVSPHVLKGKEVKAGTAGVCIVLTKEQAKEVYPIPKELRLWFGDDWIYDTLRKKYKTVVVPNFLVFHYGSQGIQGTPNAENIIEEDKIAWQKIKETI